MSKKKLKSRVKELERKVSYLETVVTLMRCSMNGEGNKEPPIDGLVVEELSTDLNIGSDPPCQFSIEVTRIFGDGPEQKGRPHYILMNEGMTKEECQVAADELRKKEEESGTQIRHEYKVVA